MTIIKPTTYEHYLYIIHLLLIISGLLVSCFLFNIFIDPLWYWKGNQLTQINLPSNERLSKINLFLQQPDNYNCFIFGSSRTTLLNQNEIKDYHCFNFSFSSGNINEFIDYAEYLKHKGYSPELVILGVDGFNFFSDNKKNTPNFILQKNEPQNILEAYLSIGSLRLSRKNLLGISYLPRYYKNNFTASIFAPIPTYQPKLEKTADNNKVDYKITNIESYLKFRKIFENASYIAYAPPVSAWKIYDLKTEGKIDEYLNAMYSISNIYQPFYDFTIPSFITKNKKLTYDGSHYNLATNQLITARINKEERFFGLQLEKLSHQEYLDSFYSSIHSFEKSFIKPNL